MENSLSYAVMQQYAKQFFQFRTTCVGLNGNTRTIYNHIDISKIVVRVISYRPVRLIHLLCTTAITQYNICLSSTCVCSLQSLRSIYNNGSIRLDSLKEQGNNSQAIYLHKELPMVSRHPLRRITARTIRHQESAKKNNSKKYQA